MADQIDQWDPSRDIAAGSVSSNAAKLFGDGAFVKPKKAKQAPQSITVQETPHPPIALDPTKNDEQEPTSPSGGQWDPSRDIKRGSVSSNAAALFGEGAFVKKKKVTSPGRSSANSKAADAKLREAFEYAQAEAEADIVRAKKEATMKVQAAEAKKREEIKDHTAGITGARNEAAEMAGLEKEAAKKEAHEAKVKTEANGTAELAALAEEPAKKAAESEAKARAEEKAKATKQEEEEPLEAGSKTKVKEEARAAKAEAEEVMAAEAKAKLEEETRAAKRQVEKAKAAEEVKKAQAELAKQEAEQAKAAEAAKTEDAKAKTEEASKKGGAKPAANEMETAGTQKAAKKTKDRNANGADGRALKTKKKDPITSVSRVQSDGAAPSSRKAKDASHRRAPNQPQSLLLGRFQPSPGVLLRCTDSEVLLRAKEVHAAGGATPVILQLMSDSNRFSSELSARSDVRGARPGSEPSHILSVTAALRDANTASVVVSAESTSRAGEEDANFITIEECVGLSEEVETLLLSYGDATEYDATDDEYGETPDAVDTVQYPYMLVLEDHGTTLEGHIDRFSQPNLRLARSVAGDVVVGLILLHTEGRVHRDLSPRNIVRATLDADTEAWKISGLGTSGRAGEVMNAVGKQCQNWGYLPPEAASAVLFEEGLQDSILDEDESCTTDPAWDLWALGCVLYRLVFGSELWTVSRNGRISDEDLEKLASWSKLDVWRRSTKAFPLENRTDGDRAAIDLVARLLAPTPKERIKNFEFGIISVHQHEFIEGKPLEPPNLQSFLARQDLLTIEEQDRARFQNIMGNLSLEESWELNRARDVLLLGAFEPVEVHVPTSFVILKTPLSQSATASDGNVNDDNCTRALEEGMKWVSVLDDVGPLVQGALLKSDVGSVGRFWARINGMFLKKYVYFYFVDDLTGEPVVLPPGQSTVGNGVPYPIPIKTRSDVLPKLLPLMHSTMRSVALYHGAKGISRMFGGVSDPKLANAARQSVQQTVNDLKSETGGAASGPFGNFVDDVGEARKHRERFLRKEQNLRCRALIELMRFYENKGVTVRGRARGADDFVGLLRLSDEKGRAMWTVLDSAEGVQAAIEKRAEERLMEERNLWDDKHDKQIRDLEETLEKSTNHQESERKKLASVAEEKALEEMIQKQKELDEAKADAIQAEANNRLKVLEDALAVAKAAQTKKSKEHTNQISDLQKALQRKTLELEAASKKFAIIEKEIASTKEELANVKSAQSAELSPSSNHSLDESMGSFGTNKSLLEGQHLGGPDTKKGKSKWRKGKN